MKRLLKNHYGALIAWIVIVLIAIFALPNVNSLTREHSEIKLPSSVQSSVATQIQDQWGHKENNTYVVGVVFNKKDGRITKTDQERINATIDSLKDNKKKYGIKAMLTPHENEVTKKQLISKDGTTEVVQLNIDQNHSTVSNVNTDLMKNVKTKGIRTYVTGERILEDDFSAAVQNGIKKTEVISVIFIFIVLVLVFKSPIVPFISLLTVGVSFITAFSIVTNLVNKFNFPFSNFTQVFMVIVLFGIGTDYNILLYDQFKENLGKGMKKHEATKNAQFKAGKTILYSGSSILIGFTALGFAQFSVYQSAVGVAIGVAVLLIVLLTLNPFFMAILGKKMFWPVKTFEGEGSSKLWHGISKNTLKRPLVSLAVVAILVIPFFFSYSSSLNYNDADEIADSTPSKAGLLVLQDHFSKGMPEYSTLYIKSKHTLDNEKDLKNIDHLLKQIQADKNVKWAGAVTQPNGEPIKKLYVNNQLETVNSGTNDARKGLVKLSDGTTKITNGALQLQTGANQLQAGTVRLADGAGRLESGTLSLEQGAIKLQNGTQFLVNGANVLYTGSQSLQSGTQSLASGLTLLSAQLSSQMSSSNKTQLAQIQEALPKINSGIQQLNQALNKSSDINTTEITSALTNVGTQAAVIGTNLTDAGTTLQSMQGKSKDAQAQYEAAAKSAGLDANQQKIMGTFFAQMLESQSQQLGSVADNIQKAGAADKSLGDSLTSVAGTMQNLQGMMGQVATLKTQVNTLATASNIALPGAVTALNSLDSGLSKVQGAVAQGATGASQINDGAAQLTNGAGQLSSGLAQGASGSAQLANGAAQLTSGAGQLSSGLNQGASGAGQLSSGIGQIATNSPQLTNGINKINTGLGTAQEYLGSLSDSAAANTFYIPEDAIHGEEFQSSINAFLSSDLKSAKVIIMLKTDPSTSEAGDQANGLSNLAKKSLKGTSLENAKIAMGGQSQKIHDTQDVSSHDFIRTAAIMLIGIGIALIFITRSVLQPVFILGTLLIAYVTSLSITQLLIKPILGRDILTWNTPFFSFIMLIALGVDYSIFLVMRYRELGEDKSLTPSQKILHACDVIGTVVISAAIILGGTFAALIPSGVPTLIEVAMVVIIGLLLLVFLIPINMSAAIKITYEGLGKSKEKTDK